MAAPLQCRWGVIGCGSDSGRFVRDIQTAGTSKASYLPIQHSVAALSGDTPEETAAFNDIHFSGVGPSSIGSSGSLHSGAPVQLENALDLAKSHLIDAVLFGSDVPDKLSLVEAALTAKKSVVLIRPIDLTAEEARSLCGMARSLKTFFGVLIKESKKDKMSLRFIADEAARCRERAMAESSLYAWEDTASLLEVLEDLRRTGSLPPKPQHQKTLVADVMPLTPAQTPNLGHDEQQRQDESPSKLPEQQEIRESTDVTEIPQSSKDTASGAELDVADNMTPKSPETPLKASPELAVTPVNKAHVDATDAIKIAEVDLAPRRYPRTPAPPPGVSLIIEETEGDSEADASHNTIEADTPTKESRTSSDASSKTTSRSNSSLSGGRDANQTATLRAQLQELKHMLRQKNAQIAALEQSNQGKLATLPAGPAKRNSVIRLSMGGNGSAQKAESKRQAAVQPPVTKARIPRTSRPLSVSAVSTVPMPSAAPAFNGSSFASAADGIEQPIRRRRDSSMTPPLGPTSASNRPRRPSEGKGSFLTPTVASENRRIANLSQQANGIASRRVSGASEDGSSEKNSLMSKVIVQLTAELEAARNQSNASRMQLTSVQRNLASLQKAYDSAKQSLEQARIEGDRHATALLRKEKILNETLERARKAEAEAKELGRASREWGARVRQVESELGEVRVQQARAESGYEAVTSAWKKTKEHWGEEVRGLRKELQDVIQTHRDEARSVLSKFAEVEGEWKGREGERKGLEAVLEGLRVERERAKVEVVKSVADLVSRLEAHEGERQTQEQRVDEVREELSRLLALMRSGETDQAKIREVMGL